MFLIICKNVATSRIDGISLGNCKQNRFVVECKIRTKELTEASI